MELMIITGIVLIIFIFVLGKTDTNNNVGDTKNKSQKLALKKALCFIVLFGPVFVVYYFLIALVSAIPLFFIAGAESGAWAFSMILGFIGSPILTVITMIKILIKMDS